MTHKKKSQTNTISTFYNIPFFVRRVEARNPACIDCGYQVGFCASTRPTEEWSKNN